MSSPMSCYLHSALELETPVSRLWASCGIPPWCQSLGHRDSVLLLVPRCSWFYRSLFTGLETFNERLDCYILPGLVKVWPQSCQPLLIYSFICCGVAKVSPYILNDYWYTGLWWHFEDTFCQCFNKLYYSLEWFFYPFNSFIYLNYIVYVYTLKVNSIFHEINNNKRP